MVYSQRAPHSPFLVPQKNRLVRTPRPLGMCSDMSQICIETETGQHQQEQSSQMEDQTGGGLDGAPGLVYNEVWFYVPAPKNTTNLRGGLETTFASPVCFTNSREINITVVLHRASIHWSNSTAVLSRYSILAEEYWANSY